jgi:protein SCO1/2
MTRNQRLAACAFAITTPLLALTACDDGFQPIDARNAAPVTADARGGETNTPDTPADPAPIPPADAATADAAAAPATADPNPLALPAPVDRDTVSMDYGFTDQSGEHVKLSDFKGKPIVASFIFTKCPDPKMCPMVASKFRDMQDHARRDGIADDFWLLLISFDLNFDTAEKLRQWGQTYGVSFTNARMLLPDRDSFPDFVREYGLRIGAVDGQLTHKLDMVMLDAEGRLVHVIQGEWETTQVYDSLKELVEEQKATG